MDRKTSLEDGLLLPSSSNDEPKSIIVNSNADGGDDGHGHGDHKDDDDDSYDGHDDSSSGVTAAVILSTFIAICGSFGSGCSSGYSSPAESGIMKDLHLSVAAYSVFGSLITVGGMIGSLIVGRTMDLIGRKGTMWLAELFYIIGWLVIAFSENAWSLDLGRVSLGIAFGLMIYVVPIYIAEITHKNIRGGFTASGQFSLACGFSLMYFLGTAVPWRALALIAIVPCVIQVVGLFFIPESPRWLAKIGRERELETTLQYLRGEKANVALEAANIIDYTETFEKESQGGFFHLFQKKYAYPLMVGVGLMLVNQLGGANGIAYYASSIFEEAGFSSNVGTITVAIIQVPAVGVSVLLIDKFGRKPLLTASTVGTCICSFFVALGFCFQELHYWKEVTPLIIYISIMGYTITYSIGVGGLPWVILSEIFPINIKGSAGSLATFVQWSTSWIVTYTFNFLMEWSTSGTFFLFAGMSALSAIFTVFLVPETKGRALEEIQASITHL